MPITVEPNESAPATAPVEATASAPSGADASAEKAAKVLPDEVIQIPTIQALLVGKPPAASASIADFAKRPEGILIQKYKDPLFNAGFGLYRSLSGDIGVLFNRFFLSDSELQAADKAGQLTQLAPPFDDVGRTIGQAGKDHPLMAEGLDQGRPQAFKAGAPAVPEQVPPAPQVASKPESTKLIAAKNRNLSPGSPTSGPVPGSGRLLNSILKPVI